MNPEKVCTKCKELKQLTEYSRAIPWALNRTKGNRLNIGDQK